MNNNLFAGDIYAGLFGLDLDQDSVDLGEGITLRKTYAHLMAPFVMAFAPAPPGQHHPAPWKRASAGFAFDLTAELTVPASLNSTHGDHVSIAKAVLFLLRLSVNPAIRMPILSNHAFSQAANVPDDDIELIPFEIHLRYFPLAGEDGPAKSDALCWVRDNWTITHKLASESAKFALGIDAISSGQFVKSTTLILVAIWGALEALFSPSTTELKFRVSSLISAFLEPYGYSRGILQKRIAKLYDKRSAAAHGKPTHETEDVLASFDLLRRVMIKIIDNKRVPSKEDLENTLFGSLGMPDD